jgi:drug/metabolite transporter (DMT)-like permease
MSSSAQDHHRVGTWALLGAILLFSTVEIAIKIMQVQCAARIDPFLLVFMRFFVTGLVLVAAGLPGARRRGLRLGVRDYVVLGVNGLLGITLSISLFHVAVQAFRNASSAAVVFSAHPVFVALFAPLINRERLSLRQTLGVLLGGTGVLSFALESGHLEHASARGLQVMVCSALFFALSVCLSRRIIARYGPLLTMGISSLFGSVLVLPVGLWHSTLPVLPELAKGLVPLLYVALAGTTLAYALYYYGLACTSAARASAVFFLKPVVATVLAVLLRGERVNAYTVSGTGLILVGLVAVWVGNNLRAKSRPGVSP